MRDHRLDLTFYGRSETITIPTDHAEFTRFLDAVKRLAADDKKVPAFYLFGATPEVSVVVSVGDVQTAYAILGGDGHFGDVLVDKDVALFLRGRPHITEPGDIEGTAAERIVLQLRPIKYLGRSGRLPCRGSGRGGRRMTRKS